MRVVEVYHTTLLRGHSPAYSLNHLEKKTEAAAASAVLMVTISAPLPTPPPPIEMRIDRPFIFLIRNQQTDAMLFVGRVMDPTR